MVSQDKWTKLSSALSLSFSEHKFETWKSLPVVETPRYSFCSVFLQLRITINFVVCGVHVAHLYRFKLTQWHCECRKKKQKGFIQYTIYTYVMCMTFYYVYDFCQCASDSYSIFSIIIIMYCSQNYRASIFNSSWLAAVRIANIILVISACKITVCSYKPDTVLHIFHSVACL